MPQKHDDRLFMWAGGKARLIPYYRPLFPADIDSRAYVEPFAGGAALFNYLSSNVQIRATLADINEEIMALYRLVRDDPGYLVGEMDRLERGWMPLAVAERKDLYYRLRRHYWSMPDGPAASALLYFLMKTGFNGIWQTCKASKGAFGTPVGLANQKTGVYTPGVVGRWSEKLAGVDLRCCSYDAVEVPADGFVFCDPPYRSSHTSYGTEFADAEHIRLLQWCRDVHLRTGAVVWLSNRDSHDRFFEHHAPDARMHRFPITYTAGRRKRTADGYAAMPATELLMVWE